MLVVSKFKVFMRNLNRFHKNQLLASNVLSTMGLVAIGDVFAQYIEIKLTVKRLHEGQPKLEKSEEHSFYRNYDFIRTAKITASGIVTGPFGHYWYTFLDKRFKGRSMASISKKCFFDQLIAAPIFTLIVITVIHTIDGKHLRQIAEIFKEKFLVIYAYDCSFWPLAQFINFYFVPAVYRLLYVNIISVLWNSFLSYLLFGEVD